MKKSVLGLITGTVLGLLDGASAIFIPEAREMLSFIIIFAALKGTVTGLLSGIASKKLKKTAPCVLVGGGIGLILSFLTALQSGSFMDILVPGTVLGLVVGYVTAKWGR